MTQITAEHLARGAFIYVRQSTSDQVLHNHESRRRQYGLADRARALGWSAVEVIDDDLGRSGSGIARPGLGGAVIGFHCAGGAVGNTCGCCADYWIGFSVTGGFGPHSASVAWRAHALRSRSSRYGRAAFSIAVSDPSSHYAGRRISSGQGKATRPTRSSTGGLLCPPGLRS